MLTGGGRDAMRLLSWNIQWGRGLDGRVDLARILRTIHALGEFDVVCLQEVAVNFPGLPGSRGEDEVAELAVGLPGYTAVFGAATDVPDGRSARCGATCCRGRPNLTPSMQRVLVEAVVTADVGPLRVLTTHLEYYSRRQRQSQIDAIRRLHTEACAMSARTLLLKEQGGAFEVFPRSVEAILCGDMNFPATAPERAQILAPFADGTPGFEDAWEVLHPRVPHAPTVGIHPVGFVDQPECFDFVFATSGLSGRLRAHGIDAATAASDHQPVWVELA